MLIHEFLNKDPGIFPEEVILIILDGKSDVCRANNVNYSKHTSHISMRMYFLRNGEKFKMHKIYWCEGGLQLVDIATKNVSENALTPSVIYNGNT